ncbi:hypothetical protein LTR62_004640 [Meristemomyces frigidus]|uniref:Anaphase-promoting complex subunit 5 n=1 Tax=Meristemomyces frigidus TaxID=1508187 RepID=A0AAN7YRA4_9PEZI|nr:hypothetical protein LTR62_004640 [Meristemomyces frigidus]
MPRYLTPQRIGVLVLLQEYLTGRVSASTQLPVLKFVAKHIDLAKDHESVSGTDILAGADATVEELFAPLRGLAWAIPGRTLYDVVLQALWNLQNLDALHGFFERVAQSVNRDTESGVGATNKNILTRASPIGLYCRRCWLEFTRLEFEDTRSLWVAYATWRSSSYEFWSQRNPEAAAQSRQSAAESDEAHPVGLSSASAKNLLSTADVNNIITTSIYHLQKLGTRAPPAMKTRLRTWLTEQHDSGVQSLQHFMAFFDHWKAGQYTMALESLHRYFDYSLATKAGSNDNMRIYYQYALLHLSVLHADFGCWEDSVDAMNECIATARENHDSVCLNFALSWLLYLRQAKPDKDQLGYSSASGFLGAAAGEQDEIGFLKSKAKDTKHWSLLSSTLLEEAKLEMHSSGVTASSIEHIVQAAFVNMQHDQQTLMPAAGLLESAALERLGHSHIASGVNDTIDYVYTNQAPLADRVRSVCRMAHHAALIGHYRSGLEALQKLMPVVRGILKLEQRILGFMTLVELAKSLAMTDLDHARYHLRQLGPLQALGDPEIDYEVSMYAIELAIQEADFEQAMAMVNSQLQRTKRSTSNVDILQRLHFMVLKARVLIVSGQAVQGFSIAARAASTAMRLRLVPVLLEATLCLAVILNELAEYTAAVELLEAAMPKMAESRSLRLVARAFVALGEAHVGTAGSAVRVEQTRLLRNAAELFERAKAAYTQLSDHNGVLDCLAMLSLLARHAGDEHSAVQVESLYAQALHDKQRVDLSA